MIKNNINTKNNMNISYTPTFVTEETKQKFFREQYDMYKDVREGKKTWADLNEFRQEYGFPDVNVDSLRRSFTQLGLYDDMGWVRQTAEGAISKIEDAGGKAEVI